MLDPDHDASPASVIAADPPSAAMPSKSVGVDRKRLLESSIFAACASVCHIAIPAQSPTPPVTPSHGRVERVGERAIRG